MPIYEYDCKNCGDSFDKLVRITAAATEVTCPACSSSEVKKRLSLFSSKIAGSVTASAGSAVNCAPGGG
jgi:putative FmdB family regulatory protein